MGPTQREFEAILPIGYTDQAGHVHRRAVLRKMRGYEEALLYDANLTASRLITELLRSCLVRLGDIEPVTSQVVAELYSADRNYLLLELRRVTLGDRLSAAYLCPGCGSAVTVIEDLSRVEVRWLEDGKALEDITLELEDGYVDREGTLHTALAVTLPRGVDEEFVAPMLTKDPLKARDSLVLRCVKRFGTLPKAALEAYGVKIIHELTLGDRWLIQRTLNEQSPGVDFQRTLHCDRCGTVFQTVLDVTGFFVFS